MGRYVAGGMFLLLLACSNAPPGGAPNDSRTDVAPQNDLVTSLEVEVGADAVRFVLHVTNSTNRPIALEFPSAQRYDFVVQSPDGREVWRWSADQMFGQVVGSESLPAGGSRDFTVTWRPVTAPSGAYTAIARVTASNRRIEQRAEFKITKT